MRGGVQGNVSARKSSEPPAMNSSCSLQMSQPGDVSASLFCPRVKNSNWICSCLASKATHLTSRPWACRYLSSHTARRQHFTFLELRLACFQPHLPCLRPRAHHRPVPISVSLVPLMKIRFYALQSDLKQSQGNAVKPAPAVSGSLCTPAV